jgi:hypothetical protein
MLNLAFFIVALIIVVSLVGFGAWALAHSFVYLTVKTHKFFMFLANRLIVPTYRFFARKIKPMYIALAKSIKQLFSKKPKTPVEIPVPAQLHEAFESETDWDIYDVPSYIRKGTALL